MPILRINGNDTQMGKEKTYYVPRMPGISPRGESKEENSLAF